MYFPGYSAGVVDDASDYGNMALQALTNVQRERMRDQEFQHQQHMASTAAGARAVGRGAAMGYAVGDDSAKTGSQKHGMIGGAIGAGLGLLASATL